jgi:hypothetical protein
MSIDDIEAEVLKLDPQARARLAKKPLKAWKLLRTRRMSASGQRRLMGATPTGTQPQVLPVQPPTCFGTLGPS